MGKDFFERRYYDDKMLPIQIWQIRGDTYYEYRFSNGEERSKDRVIIRDADQLPGTEPIDPADIVSMTFGESFEKFLKSSKIVEAKKLEKSEFGAGTIELTIDNKNSGQLKKATFAAKYDFLPVRCALYDKNNTVMYEKTVEYQRAEKRNAWVLKTEKMTTQYTPPDFENDPNMKLILFHGEIITSVERYELIDEAELKKRRMEPDADWIIQDLRTLPRKKERRGMKFQFRIVRKCA